MSEPQSDDIIFAPQGTGAVLPVLLGGAVIVAALYYGQELAVPLVLAAMLAFVLAPVCALLQRLWLPRALAVLLAVLLTFAVLGGLGTVVGRQAATLATKLPAYQTTVLSKWDSLTQRIGAVEKLTKNLGDGMKEAGRVAASKTTKEHDANVAQSQSQANTGQANPGQAVTGTANTRQANTGLALPFDISGLSLARTVALPILGPLGTLGITLIFAFFILVSNEDLRDRMVRLVGRRDLHRTILAMNDAASRLSRYFLFQLMLNTLFGATIGCALWIAGLPSPLLWGILAGIMRFVPFVGVIVAALPPILLAVAIVPGWSLAIVVLALFAAAEGVMGQVVEPLIYGHNTGLSPIAVIVATAFWALLWGPIGLLIATPLTVCLVVLGRNVETLSFLDVLLGDKPPLEPPETFYQRALEGRGMALAPDARRRIAAGSFVDYCDRVALPGLALAQRDLARDDAAFERLDAIYGQIAALLTRVRTDRALTARKTKPAQPAPSSPSPALPTVWRDEAAIVCVPGRGQLDDLAAGMVVDALAQAGFGATEAPNLVLGAKADGDLRFARTRVCCLSVLEMGNNEAAIRYFIRRVQKQMPGAAVVIGLWHVDRASPLLRDLRSSGGSEHVVLSIGELIAFCLALAARSPVGELTAPDAGRSVSPTDA